MRISNNGLWIIAGIVFLLLGGWVFVLYKNQKATTDTLNDVANTIGKVTDKLNDIAYRDQVVELANVQIKLEETLEPERPSIGFKMKNSNE